MISNFKRATNIALGRTRGRSLWVYPEDVFIVSYPRSGNTWMRFLVGNLVNRERPTTFTDIETVAPDIYKNSDRALSRLPTPRYLKSHEPFDRRYRRVIYIVRDPRDVAVSYYHYLIKIGRLKETFSMEEHVRSFVSGELDGFGTWRENVGSWLGARRGTEAFLFLRYEDLLTRTLEELQRVAHFISVDASEYTLNSVIGLSTADRMRDLEKVQGWKPEKSSREDKPFVRRAEAGDWQTSLPKASARLIEERWGDLMEEFGYLP